MKVGLTIFPTDYSIQPPDLAIEAEERDFESIWLPEHSHTPTSRKSPWPGGGVLPKYYYESYDPFVSLGAAAAVVSADTARSERWASLSSTCGRRHLRSRASTR